MSTVKVKVNPEIFTWVQNQVNLDTLKQSRKENFNKWVDGEKEPTFRQIEDFSKATRIPLGYFFLNEPPVENNELIEYRTIDSAELVVPSRDLIDTINEMELVQEWMKEHLIEKSYDQLDYVGEKKVNDKVIDVVESIRRTLTLEKDWYKKSTDPWYSFKIIREKLEQAGVMVMMNGVVGANTHRALNINEFRAFTLVDNLAPLIFINANDNDNGRLFSLLHEVAHIWYGTNSLFNDRYGVSSDKSIEVKCNAVAAEILLPNDLFAKKWKNIDDVNIDERIKTISKEFRCGMTVVARRALDNGFITEKEYYKQADIAKELSIEKKKKGSTGGNYYNTALTRIDKRLLLALYNSAYEGKTAFTDVYKLTNTTRKTFVNLINEVRGNV